MRERPSVTVTFLFTDVEGSHGCCMSLGYVGEDVHRAARINDLEWGEVSLVVKQRIE